MSTLMRTFMDLGRSAATLGYSLWGVTVIRYEDEGCVRPRMVVWAGSAAGGSARSRNGPTTAPARAQAPAATAGARSNCGPAARTCSALRPR
jgi:hypothetical protein